MNQSSKYTGRLKRVTAFAENVWGSRSAARRFLVEPHPLLGGRTPHELAHKSDRGARAVESLLGRLKYGSAA